MKVVKQLSIFLKNVPGTLSKVTSQLKSDDINILGFTVSDTVDHAVIRLVVDKPQKALHVFGEAGLLVLDNNILSVSMANQPGELDRLSRILSKNNVNIDYCYGTLSPDDFRGTIYIKVNDVDKALELLSE